MRWIAGLALVVVAGLLFAPVPNELQTPRGVFVLHRPLDVYSNLLCRGATFRMAPDFEGRAALIVRASGILLTGFTIEGNRDTREFRAGLPPSDVPFARFTQGSGILAVGVQGLGIHNVRMRNIAGFAVLVSRSRDVGIGHVTVEDSGSRDAAGRNNTTGGILLEEGTSDFGVVECELRRVRGNGIWTHSLYTSPRNGPGRIWLNSFDTIGRDAIQVGHASGVEVEKNSGRAIGEPKEIVDATPVAIDTAGNVDDSFYFDNVFEDINGKCIDLDGFHDGEIRKNVCANVGGYGVVMNNTNPDMQSRNIRVLDNRIENALYGGIFVIGAGNWIARNKLLNLNSAHCDGACYNAPGQPGLLESGIYLGAGAERPAPAHNNTVEENEITGFKMKARCVESAPGVGPNVIRGNVCRDESTSSPTSTPRSPSRSGDRARP